MKKTMTLRELVKSNEPMEDLMKSGKISGPLQLFINCSYMTAAALGLIIGLTVTDYAFNKYDKYRSEKDIKEMRETYVPNFKEIDRLKQEGIYSNQDGLEE